MSETPDLESTADRVVAALRNIDGKVNAKRDQRLNDPDPSVTNLQIRHAYA